MKDIQKSELVRSLSLPAHSMNIDDIIAQLSTDLVNGISVQEVDFRQKMYGPNIIPSHKQSLWQIYFAPLVEWLIVAYLIMTGIMIVLAVFDSDLWTTALQWLIIVFINFGIAIFQQFRAQKKIDALQKLSAVEGRVVRGGFTTTCPTEDLVPGDIIEVAQGNRIPADCRIISSNNLLVNESSLTGESVPVSKVEEGNVVLEEDISVAERSNMLFNGTFIAFGSARAVVCNTGGRTEIGRISIDLDELNTGEIPLRNKVNQIGKMLTFAMIIFLAITLTINIFKIQDQLAVGDYTELISTLSNSILTAMSIMPINIPLLTTIVLITGVLAMATYGVVIRNLSAVESLGRASILCSDKTGTITRSQMTAKRVWDSNGYLYGVTGLGYGPSGVIFPIKDEASLDISEENAPTDMMSAAPGSALEMILISGLLNNDAKLIIEDFIEEKKKSKSNVSWKATGSPTDAALIAMFKKSGIDETEIRNKYHLEREYPFDSRLKRMSKVYRADNPGIISFTKGAAEILLPLCTKIGSPGKEKPFDNKKSIQDKINSFAALGYRVLVFTYKKLPKLPLKGDENERNDIESDLTLLGFTCLSDPPRKGVKESVNECLKAGIKTIMITGDSLVTGTAIAREINMLEPDSEVHEGKEIESLDDEGFFQTRVFARVSPKHKQIIIEKYQNRDQVCGMTGDGVNDALALSMADAGIVMGITGTDVAKQAGDLIITDDSFNSIVTGIKQGRGLFQKIRLMIFFYIAVNMAEALVYFTTSLMDLPEVFLETWQRMYVFGFVHSLPPMAIILDRFSGDIMDREPIDAEGIFNRKLTTALVFFAIPFAIVIFAVYFITINGTIPVNSFNMEGFNLGSASEAQMKARTMYLTVVYLVESFVVLNIRRIDTDVIRGTFSKDNRFWLVFVCVLFFPVFHILAMYIPTIQILIYNLTLPIGGLNVELLMLDPVDWVVCISAAIIPLLSLECFKAYTRSKGEFF